MDCTEKEESTSESMKGLESLNSNNSQDSLRKVDITKDDIPKVDILLKATGDAPIMKQKKWAVESCRTIGSINEFVKKYLKLGPTDSLFLYVNQCFAPCPDQVLLNLYKCFGAEGKLVIHYSLTPAWG